MADTPDYVNGEPAPEHNDGPSMHDLVINDLQRRSIPGQRFPDSVRENMIDYLRFRKRYGFEKYGTVLQAHNGRNSRRDALEEVVDLCVYLKQITEEFPDDGHAKLAYTQAISIYSLIIKSMTLHTDVTYVIGV